MIRGKNEQIKEFVKCFQGFKNQNNHIITIYTLSAFCLLQFGDTTLHGMKLGERNMNHCKTNSLPSSQCSGLPLCRYAGNMKNLTLQQRNKI